ncbi:MAG TPA: biotin--[acetyl-CoA-carboxylase] ligase, partial [Flavobacteriaceae bacterium]|nr:biotin--[acetyl-CoA-carboxylase] ligase [Flavobacteriaceae bacterium]
MRIIKLNAIDSTNTYLRQLSSASALEDYTIVSTQLQTQGRGQRGTIWESQDSKNLMFSVYKSMSFVEFSNAFCISMVTALSLVKTLKQFGVPKPMIKWPNDILSENKKVCGILIENIVTQNTLKATIIGIGLNVNQTEFPNLPQASSMLLQTGKVFSQDEILLAIVQHMKYYFTFLKKKKIEVLTEAY